MQPSSDTKEAEARAKVLESYSGQRKLKFGWTGRGVGAGAAVIDGVGLQLLYRNVQRFRGVLVFKAHRLLYHSTLGLRVITKKRPRKLK